MRAEGQGGTRRSHPHAPIVETQESIREARGRQVAEEVGARGLDDAHVPVGAP